MYKALRADNAIRLHTDFVKNQKKELADKELRHDQGVTDSAPFNMFKAAAHSGNATFFHDKVVCAVCVLTSQCGADFVFAKHDNDHHLF